MICARRKHMIDCFGESGEARLNNRKTGGEAEERAALYLTEKGMRIVERNFRNRQGEIDIIGYYGGYLVFVEVKYRRNHTKGSPEAAVGAAKQRQICKVADYYRYLHHMGPFTPVRYDVLAIDGEEIHWYENAFTHIYTRG